MENSADKLQRIEETEEEEFPVFDLDSVNDSHTITHKSWVTKLIEYFDQNFDKIK